MESYTVKDVMVPISEYVSVPEGSTLFEAILALEKAQEDFDHSKYRHRAVLVLDKNKRVVGKLSQLNVLRALELGREKMNKVDEIGQFGFTLKFINDLRIKYRNNETSLETICSKPAKMKVEDELTKQLAQV